MSEPSTQLYLVVVIYDSVHVADPLRFNLSRCQTLAARGRAVVDKIAEHALMRPDTAGWAVSDGGNQMWEEGPTETAAVG